MPEPSRAKTAPPPAVDRFSRRVIIAAALLCGLYLIFALQLHRTTAMKVIPAAFGLLALASLRLKSEARLSFALIALPTLVVLHAFGLYMAHLKISPAAAAASAGRTYDTRSKWEVVTDLRAKGVDAYTAVQPKSVLLTLGSLRVGDAEVIPLSGVGSVETVYCNEGGEYTIYDADERGFSNPKGLWSAPAEVAVIGDSYTQGACVPPDQSFVARLRERRPRTLNLGMGGNGPLLELAAVREYLPLITPKIVLWSYFRNDLPDLSVEKRTPLLMRYLEPGFRQGLADKQVDIDVALRAMVNQLGPEAPRWPAALASIGLTRTSTPVALQDLIMGEDNSSAGTIFRLDPVAALVDAHSGAAGDPPDFELFGRVLARAKADIEAMGGTMYFVYIADMYATGKVAKLHPLRDRVLETARAAGLPIIDTSPAFQAVKDLESIRYNPTSHCSPGGYALLARVINEALDAQPAH